MLKRNPRILEELMREAELADAMERIAKNAESIAKDMAPVGSAADGDDDPGRFRDSLRGRVDRSGGQVAARLETDDPAWLHKEYGTSDTPAHATMRKTLDRLKV